MLVLRMLSGLLAGAWGLLGGRRRKGLVTSSLPEYFQAEPAVWTAMTVSFTCPPDPSAAEAERMRHDGEAERVVGLWLAERDRLRRAAEWHAKAARKAVEGLDGEGVLEHTRHFRRYSSACDNRDARRSGQIHSSRCTNCGSICASRDMGDADVTRETMCLFPAGRLLCAACDPAVADDSWTAKDGKRIPVREMDDRHLVNSAAMVSRWLREASRPVSDDRIRMCGHVLEECRRRGLEVKRG